jgi:hypothetical protein
MDTARRDNGSIVIGWLTKLVVFIALAGVVLFDAVSVGTAHLGATDDANQAAFAASADYRTSHSVQSAFTAAVDSITNVNERVLRRGFVIDPDGTVHLLLERTAKTVVMHDIGPLRHFGVMVVAGEASPPTL